MMSSLALVTLGFFLGMRHATDADHVVAVAAIVSRERSLRGAGIIGALWGLGHTMTIVLVGGAIVLFGLALPARVGLGLEMAVGVMLVTLGTMNVVAAWRGVARAEARRDPRPLFVGIVHGLAGSAAVALLVLSTVKHPPSAMAFLALFGVGTIVGMMLITSLIALPFAFAAGRFEGVQRHLGWVSGLLSVVFGVGLVYQVGFVDGFFSATPHWVPR